MSSADDVETEISPPRRPATFRDVPWTWKHGIIALAPLVIARMVAPWFIPLNGPLSDILSIGAKFLPLIWMLGYPLWVARRRGIRIPLPTVRSTLVEGVVAIPMLFGIWLLLILIFSGWIALSGPPRMSNPIEPFIRSQSRASLLVLAVLAVTAAPIYEEILFRGMIYNLLRNRLGIVIGILLQAFLFGFLHTFGIVHAIFATVLGVVLAAAYEWRRTLLSPIFIHAFQNTTAVVATAAMVALSPMLGIAGERHPNGCQLTLVAPASAAEEAGLRKGDIVTKINGRPIVDITEIVSIVRTKKIGDRLDIEFHRGGETHSSTAVLKSQFSTTQ